MSFRSNLKKIRAGYPAEKRVWDRAHLWIGYVARPLSWPLSAWLFGLGVTANQVTFLTALFGYGALVLIASGRDGWMLAGAVALLLYNILDCVDGNLARVRPPERPPRGKFFDQLVGHSYPLSYFILGLGLRGSGGGVPAWKVVHEGVAATEAWQVLALGAAATIAKYLSTAIRHDFWKVLGKDWASGKRSDYVPPTRRWTYAAYCTATELQSHVILLPVCLWMGWAVPFLKISAAVLGAELAVVGALYLHRAVKTR